MYGLYRTHHHQDWALACELPAHIKWMFNMWQKLACVSAATGAGGSTTLEALQKVWCPLIVASAQSFFLGSHFCITIECYVRRFHREKC